MLPEKENIILLEKLEQKSTIYVTKPFLPPLEEYIEYLNQIWKNEWVTNNGPLVRELERRLKEYLGVKHLFFLSNGTIGLQIAIKVLGLTGEIITTPFSYVATVNSILWENCKPVFVDIDSNTLCLDADKVENAITETTQAVLPTHVYGIPCNVEKINAVAKKHNLKVIYDAAHSFGTIFKNRHLSVFGDISVLSFHATKLFHTIEGGAIITNNDVLAEKIRLFRSFGHDRDDYFSIGINGKNSEFHAAVGLCLLPRMEGFIKKREELSHRYQKHFSGLNVQTPRIPENIRYNYSYYPILLQDENQLLRVMEGLRKNDIYPRRYFYPSLNQLQYLKGESCPVSENYAKRVLCLPLYYQLTLREIDKIAKIILNEINR